MTGCPSVFYTLDFSMISKPSLENKNLHEKFGTYLVMPLYLLSKEEKKWPLTMQSLVTPS